MFFSTQTYPMHSNFLQKPMVNNRTIYSIQNISALLDLLEYELNELNVLLTNKQRNTVFKYLIARTLFKSGGLNANYRTNAHADIILEEIRRKMINESQHRHLTRLILDEVYLPHQLRYVEDTGIDIDLLGDLLILAKS